jgi:putative tricarboxylic transport membrane protein
MSSDNGDDGATVGVRWPELITAVALMGLAVLVISDSLRVGTGWGDDGPRSGYFPFYIGLFLLVSSAWITLKQLLAWRRVEIFAERSQIVSVLAVLVPMIVYVGLVAMLGIYVASIVLIGYFMIRHGRHGVALTAAVAIGVPLLCFLVFERWFLVPLPKGPLEALLGF